MVYQSVFCGRLFLVKTEVIARESTQLVTAAMVSNSLGPDSVEPAPDCGSANVASALMGLVSIAEQSPPYNTLSSDKVAISFEERARVQKVCGSSNVLCPDAVCLCSCFWTT